METGSGTADTLRGLVHELEQKLPTPEPIVILPKLDPVKATTRHYTGGVPLWLAFVAVTVLLVGLGFGIVRPWNEVCIYGGDLCKIAAVDLDDLQRSIPDSELLVLLPDLALVDLRGDMTAGDLFAMERFSHVDFVSLISDEDIEQLLNAGA